MARNSARSKLHRLAKQVTEMTVPHDLEFINSSASASASASFQKVALPLRSPQKRTHSKTVFGRN
eukprot:2391981-Amphidinium_carterae.1